LDSVKVAERKKWGTFALL